MLNITPYIPLDKLTPEQDEKVVSMVRLDASLNSGIPKPLRKPMEHLLRVVNACYSCKIEGNSTHPADLIRAQEMPDIKETEDLREVKRLLEVEVRVAQGEVKAADATLPATLTQLHRNFYQGTPPERLKVRDDRNDQWLDLVPGELRQHDVEVGKHIAQPYQEIPDWLNVFHQMYRLDRVRASQAMLATAASHHRLAYIHPFLDGNGRVARLFTDLYLRGAGLGGVGLWSMSRGFGRDAETYYAALAQADRPRQGTGDGRGTLSDQGATQFYRIFYRHCNRSAGLL